MSNPTMNDWYPLPWKQDDNRPGSEGTLAIYDADGNPVIFIRDMETIVDMDLALAAGIVTAVNAHADLVAALKQLVQIADSHDAPAWNWESAAAVDAARAALDKAGAS